MSNLLSQKKLRLSILIRRDELIFTFKNPKSGKATEYRFADKAKSSPAQRLTFYGRFELVRMIQVNTDTNYKRSIRRIKAPTGASSGGWEFWDGRGSPGDRSQPLPPLLAANLVLTLLLRPTAEGTGPPWTRARRRHSTPPSQQSLGAYLWPLARARLH